MAERHQLPNSEIFKTSLKSWQRRRTPPCPLALQQTSKSDQSTTLNSVPTGSNCEICLKTLACNPRLCDDCQVWNGAKHAFQCLRDLNNFSSTGPCTLGDLLSRRNCMMCQAVANSILQRFNPPDSSDYQELLRAEITISGPYCLGEATLRTLDTAFYESIGEYKIEVNDLRLPHSITSTDDCTEKDCDFPLRTIVYLTVTTSKGSQLRSSIPELDAYKVVDTEANPGTQSTEFIRGVHRSFPEFGTGLMTPTIGLQLDLRYSNSMTGLSQVERWEKPYLDIELMKSWVKSCEVDHGVQCATENTAMGLPRGFRVIDTLRLCVLELPSFSTPRFVALSYTWGSPTGTKELQLETKTVLKLKQDGSLACENISKTISDAIKLCLDLGERYLWVDRLCIVQDDPTSKHSQIQSMDRIYSMAAFTIIVAVQNTNAVGLPGVKGRSRKSSLWNNTRRFSKSTRTIYGNILNTIMPSVWNTRGWTYQEHMLSPRCIYITEFQAYFSCKKMTRSEDIVDGELPIKEFNYDEIQDYASMVSTYTERKLSYETDILNAFAGVGNRFARIQGTSNIYGLPEKYITQSLLWENGMGSQRRTSVPGIPSWSWAAWTGKVKYHRNGMVDDLIYGTLVRFYFQDALLGLRKLDAEESWFSQNVCLDILKDLPSFDGEPPRMRHMPEATISKAAWKECPHNLWETSSHPLEDDARIAASECIGSLVFTTTAARLLLRRNDAYQDTDSPSLTILDIYDNESNQIGQMAKLDQSWIDEKLDLTTTHEFIVLSAGVLSKISRRVILQECLIGSDSGCSSKAIDRHQAHLWCLNVMLIERDSADDRIACRLGIGAVQMRLWKQCNPKWLTVVLK